MVDRAAERGEQVQFRPATEADSEVVARLWAATFDDKFAWVLGPEAVTFVKGWLARDPGVYLGTTLACIDGEPAGYVFVDGYGRTVRGRVWPLISQLIGHYGFGSGMKRALQFGGMEMGQRHSRKNLHINMIGVLAQQRGKGLGWCLLEHAESIARERGNCALTLGVVESNTGAIALYERFGFTLGKHVVNPIAYWCSGHRGYYDMRKDLG
ncbi:MAG: N-acetyltransferase family protein [Candidatus Hydrogenedentota bacterium]